MEGAGAVSGRWSSLGLFAAAWIARAARPPLNSRRRSAPPACSWAARQLLALAASAALFWAPYATGLDPVAHVYPATVWVIAIWTASMAPSAR